MLVATDTRETSVWYHKNILFYPGLFSMVSVIVAVSSILSTVICPIMTIHKRPIATIQIKPETNLKKLSLNKCIMIIINYIIRASNKKQKLLLKNPIKNTLPQDPPSPPRAVLGDFIIKKLARYN